MYWEVIDSVIKEIRYQILTEERTIGTKFAKIIRNKRPYIRISVPLFQHRLKCKFKKRPYDLYIRIFNFLQERRVFLDMFWLPYE